MEDISVAFFMCEPKKNNSLTFVSLAQMIALSPFL